MFGLGPVEITIGLVVIFFLEIALFWAASAVADAPPMAGGKLLLVVLVVTTLSVALTGALGYYSGVMKAPFDPDNRTLVLITAGLALVVLWAVPAVLYPMLAGVSIPRAMWLSLLQLLLRAFLYVFLTALVMVFLAVYQILTATDSRTELLDLWRQVANLSILP